MADQTRTHAAWIGRTVYDRNGDKLGDITDIFYDTDTGQPEWLTVSTGWFGTKEQFVPIAGSRRRGDDIEIDFDKDHVKDAPAMDTGDGRLSDAEERRLYSHYGFDHTGVGGRAIYGDRDRADAGYAYSDPRTRRETGTAGDRKAGDAGDRVVVDARTSEGATRVRRYVVTDTNDRTVPLREGDEIVVEDDVRTSSSAGRRSR